MQSSPASELLSSISHQIILASPLHPSMNVKMHSSIKLALLLTTILCTYATPATPATLLTPLYKDSATTLVVNLGYARYQGYYDSDFGLNVFKGCARDCQTFYPLTLWKRQLTHRLQHPIRRPSHWPAALASTSKPSEE